MEQNDDFKSFNDNPEIRISSTGFDLGEAQNFTQETGASGMEEDEKEESVADLMVWDSCARLIPNGFTVSCSTDEIMLFINAGSMTSRESDSGVEFTADNFYQGGDAFQTEDFISEGGDCSFVYQSA
ncbi:kinesin-like protein KIN-14R [Salvia divinorum]|uniref:Kinesin-like protein KIN-14R n=1 Tax=Salvia divinorum TaxID=28513 RepID=A0ABD1FY83_SALDI